MSLGRLALLLGEFVLGSSCFAASLTLNVFNPNQIAPPGSDVVFTGTVTNNTGAALNASDLFLNFSAYNFTILTPNQDLGNPDLTIPDGGTSPPLVLFDVLFDPSAVIGQTYTADVFVQDNFMGVSDTVTVSITAVVPEPSTAALALLPLLALLLLRRRPWTRLLGIAVFVAAMAPLMQAQSNPVRFATGETGVAITRHSTTVLRLSLINAGSAPAASVSIVAATYGGVPTMTSLPAAIGTLSPSGVAKHDLEFLNSSLTAGNTYSFVVRGTYFYGGLTYGFAVNQFVVYFNPSTPDGTTEGYSGPASGQTTNGPYSPGPTIDDNDANPEDEPTVPSNGPPTPPASFSPPQNVTTETISLLASVRPFAANDGLVSARSTFFQGSIAAGLQQNPPEPSVASKGDLVLVTGNLWAAFSSDGGKTFAGADPKTIFPQTIGNPPMLIDGGLCCDQVVVYAPTIDRFVWVMQFRHPNGVNRYRLAVAKPDDVKTNINTAWTYWDLTSAFFGIGTKWMDYPELVIGQNHLYLTFDVFETVAANQQYRANYVSRIALTDLTMNVINVFWYQDSDGASYRRKIAQNAGTTAFVYSNKNTTQGRLIEIPDNDGKFFIRQPKISVWTSGQKTDAACVSNTPDGVNWLGNTLPGKVSGGTRRLASNEIWFAWRACSDATYTQPHIVYVTLSDATYKEITLARVWNPGYAWAFPTLSTNSNNEVGMAFVVGGGGGYPNFGAGMLTGTASFPVVTAGNGANARWGDYISIRQDSVQTSLFSTVGYAITKNAANATCAQAGTGLNNCSLQLKYVRYGRSSDVP